MFEPYIIEFIEKLGESIAQSINSTRVNIRTTELLEQSQQQQEEMKAQEEELRQNMEEMLATQEEANRKEFEIKGVLDAINSSALVAMFDTKWNILSVNENFENLFEIPKEKMIGMNHSDFSDSLKNDSISLKSKVENGKVVNLTTKLNLPSGKIIWLKELYSPIKGADGDIIKIINISTDITNEKELELKLKK
jgi:PAS domain S-box-containing protein